MKPLVTGNESADGRLSPPATQLDGTLRVRWGTDKQRVKVSFRNDQGHYFEIHFYKENTQLTLVWGCTSTQCYPYLWRERQIINNYKSITHYSKKQILTKDTLPCSPCSYLHSYPTSAQCKYSFLLLGLLSYYFEVFGSVPCSRAAEHQLLRKIEHYSFISFFHLMPAKPEPFQSLMHYSHLWAASPTLFVGIMKRKTCCSTILLITLQIPYFVWMHVLYFGMRIIWHAYLFSWPERERHPPVCWGRGSPGSAALWCPPHSLWLSWSECTAEECRYPSRTEKRKWFTTWSATKEIQIPSQLHRASKIKSL